MRPNLLLIMTDQQRGDCLGIDGHPVLQTPYLDNLAAEGVRFRKAYTACPVCIPARRTIMTGQTVASHRVAMNYSHELPGATLPGELAKAGYQTHLVGKLHLYPRRKRYGFMSEDWADGPDHGFDDDYQRYLRQHGVTMPNAGIAHGCDQNGWVSRPWHLEDNLHYSNWCANKAIEFYERRDPTVPFFLKVSFFQPHQPCTPPQYYWDKYMSMDLPPPIQAEWSKVFDEPQLGLPAASWKTYLQPRAQKEFQAGYYGSIEHIDHQIGRILRKTPGNTVVMFISDHGDMLGDHQWIRKRSAYEGSARIPFLIRFPDSLGIPQCQVRDEVVELMDIMPTFLDLAGAPIPDSVDGQSLLPLIRDNAEWRDWLHGECAEVPGTDSGMQYLTNGRFKYIWYPATNVEQLFDLDNDPRECHPLTDDPDYADQLATCRERLAEILAGRPEGFVKDGKLNPDGVESPSLIPEA